MDNSENKKIEVYKEAKTVQEMTQYLHDNKRVIYNEMSEAEAQEVLLKYNYINVITPFKHVFARKDSKEHEIRDSENNHIYDNDVEFKSYYDCYNEERSKYPILMKNILEFEANFNSLVSYEILVDTDNKINNSEDLEYYLTSLQLKLLDSSEYETRIPHMKEHLTELINRIYKYHDVYCFFDRVSFGQLLTLFITLEKRKQFFIINKLKEFGWDFGVSQVPHFVKKVSMIIDIRNTLMHYNSLTILLRFCNAKKHEYRPISDVRAHEKMLAFLSKEKS